MVVVAPEARVHWIYSNPYFGVFVEDPRIPTDGKPWLWQLYDQTGKKLAQDRVDERQRAIRCIREAAHRFGQEAENRREYVLETCINCDGSGEVEFSDETTRDCSVCDGAGKL